MNLVLRKWIGCGLMLCGLVGTFGCQPGAGGTSNRNGRLNQNGSFDPRGLPAPGPLAADVINATPTAAAVFPPDGTNVPAGAVAFVWTSADENGTTLDNTVFVSDQPAVFAQPLARSGIRTPPAESEHRLSIELSQPGAYYWGVEVTDGVNTIRRPSGETGMMFQVANRVGLSDAILICPRDNQPARAATTFRWSLGTTAPRRTTVFVGRVGQANPFDASLRVFEVTPATATSRSLSAEEALPLGEELSWGLRIETPDAVLFTFEGQLGTRFVPRANVPPTGELLAPDNDVVLADNTPRFDLRWQADAGNCEDALNATVYFQLVGGAATDPVGRCSGAGADAFCRQLDAGGGLEVDLVPRLGELNLRGGNWAWGVVADDGTDGAALPDNSANGRTFRTFTRNTRPRFVRQPEVGPRTCAEFETALAALSFAYADDNGVDTVTVTLFYAAAADDVFSNPQGMMAFEPSASGQSPADAFVFLPAAELQTCPEFDHRFGFYGVELNDGVNDAVRATAEYAGPDCDQDGIADAQAIANGTAQDCNGNQVPDSCDLALGSSTDCNLTRIPDECELAGHDANGNGILDSCEAPSFPDCNSNGVPDSVDLQTGTSSDTNENGVPDECESSPLMADAGTLDPGTAGPNGYFSAESNDLSGSINPPGAQVTLQWTIDAAPSGAVVSITSPTALSSSYSIFGLSPGQYQIRFRLTAQPALGAAVSDTVTLMLSVPIP